MPRYAAIDIGSNSTRLMVAEATGSRLETIHVDREVTRLGGGVYLDGRLDEPSIALVCATLKRMAEAYRGLDVTGVRAVATAAVRDASNQQEFIDRATAAAGVPIEIVSGQEEARLIHLGVETRWPHPESRVLVVDVGGGSCELILSDRGRLRTAFSKPLGAVRLTEVFLRNDPPSALELHRLAESIEERLADPIARLKGGFDRVIATSATAAAIVCAVNRVPRARREQADRLRATTAQVRKFYRDVSGRTLAARTRVPGLGPRRAEIIVAGTAVFLHVLEAFRHASMYYLAAGVRDGIIADLARRRVGRDLACLGSDQRRAVEDMARRYGVNLKHARNVAAHALGLFEAMRPLHRLPPSNGRLLEAAAYLHDTGHLISDTAHHKHSAYIVANSDMPGFTDDERQLVSMLCRYHRKSMPAARHSPFQSLNADLRKRVTWLVPILRVADSLDRGHQQRVEEIHCQVRDGAVLLSLVSEHGVDLEQWAAERAGEVLREVYGTPLVVTQTMVVR
jgi:exopolyphosphatase / guanosine-5'-triphosphate,3'-diphosphate pyrophosphatase